MIKVTITTVTYNSAATVSKAIESVLAQTYSNIEYIIIDGASKDDTVAVAERYIPLFEQAGKRLTVISEPDNGMYDALNKGVRLASGELIGNINSDDWYEPDAVEKMVALYEREHYDLAWADINIIKRTGNMVKRAHIGKLWTTAGFSHPSMFATKETLLEFPYAIGYMDADFDMVTRAHKAGKKISLLNETVANYVFGGMSTKKSIKKSCKRVAMKYATYRRNGYSPLYWFYCVAMETAKYILG